MAWEYLFIVVRALPCQRYANEKQILESIIKSRPMKPGESTSIQNQIKRSLGCFGEPFGHEIVRGTLIWSITDKLRSIFSKDKMLDAVLDPAGFQATLQQIEITS